MRIAVITAVFGGMDTEKLFVEQELPDGHTYTRFFVNEANTPFPLPNLPPRLQAKYFKTQSHNIPLFDCHDIHVWIDGNIEVVDSGFLAKLCGPILSGDVDLTIQAHHERSTIGDEIEFILDSKNPYLLTRYGNQPLEDEYTYYKEQGMPMDAPLYSCNVFAYTRDECCIDMLDEWWRLCLEWSWFDQSAFCYLAYVSFYPVVGTVDLGGVTTSPYYTLHSHTNWNQ